MVFLDDSRPPPEVKSQSVEEYVEEQIHEVKKRYSGVRGWASRMFSRLGIGLPPQKVQKTVMFNTQLLRENQKLSSINGIMSEFQRSYNMPPVYTSRAKSNAYAGGDVIAYRDLEFDYLYSLALVNSTYRPMLTTRKQEIFRNGFVINPQFALKCESCDTTYDVEVDMCESCDQSSLVPPSIKQREQAEQLTNPGRKWNRNLQNFRSILEESQEDVDIVDNGWVVAMYDYYHKDGKIMKRSLVEVWCVHPAHMAWSLSGDFVIGEYEFTCIEHRKFVSSDRMATCKYEDVDGICGNILHPVIAVRYDPGTKNIIFRYIEGEVFHNSLWRPSSLYGFPPVITLEKALILLLKQEEYQADYYSKKRIPNAWVLVPTNNPDIVMKTMKDISRELDKDHNTIPWIPIDPKSSAKAEVIRLDDSPKEMDFIAVRDEARQRIAHFLGVSLIFQADPSTGGGLNNEGLQIAITVRAAMKAQQAINENILYPLAEYCGITDWRIELAPIEEQDEIAEIDRKIKKAQYAQAMQSIGKEVTLDQNGEDFVFSEPTEGSEPYSQDMLEQLFPDNPSLPNGTSPTKKIEGTPSEPDVAKPKARMKDPYKFTYRYPAWKDDYQFLEFRDVDVSTISVNPDSVITEEDVVDRSPGIKLQTIHHYENAEVMNPLVTDAHFNLLDGYHRLYVLQSKGQKTIRVAVVVPRVAEKTPQSSPRSIHAREQVRAPSGGVTIHGKFYPGGQFIPKNVVESLSEDEKDAVEKGEDIGAAPEDTDDNKADEDERGDSAEEIPEDPETAKLESVKKKLQDGKLLEDPSDIVLALTHDLVSDVKLSVGENKTEFIGRARKLEQYLSESGIISGGFGSRLEVGEDTASKIIRVAKSRPRGMKIPSAEKNDLRRWYYDNTSLEERISHMTSRDGRLPAETVEQFKENPGRYYIPGINDPLPEGFSFEDVGGEMRLLYGDTVIGYISYKFRSESNNPPSSEYVADFMESDHYEIAYDDFMESFVEDIIQMEDVFEHMYDPEGFVSSIVGEEKADEYLEELEDDDEAYQAFVEQHQSEITALIYEFYEEKGHEEFMESDEYSEAYQDFVNSLDEGTDTSIEIKNGGMAESVRGVGLYQYLRRELMRKADERGSNVLTLAAPVHFMANFLDTEANKIYSEFKHNTIRDFYASYGESNITDDMIVRPPKK